MPLFNFRLKPLPEIVRDWESGGFDVQQYLSGWYWLSSGWYWLETPAGDVPSNHPEFNAAFGHPPDDDAHLDYQVARFLMDWQEIMPDVLEPLPEPFADWVRSGVWAAWLTRIVGVEEQDDAPEWQVFHEARTWWNTRHLDMGYLVAPPVIQAWRVADLVTLTWDTREKRVEGHPCWVESRGSLSLPVAEWQREWVAFEARLEAAMSERLREVEALGLLGVEQVASLWEQHGKYFAELPAAARTDWAATLAAIAELEDWSGQRLPRGLATSLPQITPDNLHAETD